MTYLIIGLGNPGVKYIKNRHNVGFLAVNFILNQVNPDYFFKSEHNAMISKVKIGSTDIILAEPQTFMNLSGDSVLPLVKFYKILSKNLIIIHDDIDLEFGRIKSKFSGSNAGHNGLRDIDKKIGNNYHRIRIGVGRPDKDSRQSVADYVLSNFSAEEQKILDEKLFNDVFNFIKLIINGNK